MENIERERLDDMYRQTFCELRHQNTSYDLPVTVTQYSGTADSEIDSSTGIFRVTIEGPFLLMECQNPDPDNCSLSNYHLFVPEYMMRVVREEESVMLELMPGRIEPIYKFAIHFNNDLECSIMRRTLLKIRNILESRYFQFVPTCLNVKLIEEGETEPTNYDIHLFETQTARGIMKTIMLQPHDKHKGSVINIVVKANVRLFLPGRLSSYPFLEGSFYESFVLVHGSLRYLSFMSREQMYFTFIIIWQETERIRKARLIQHIEYSMHVPVALDDLLPDDYDDLEFINENISFPANDKEKIKCSEVPLFASVRVPPRASTQLELLSFSVPVKRNLLIVAEKRHNPTRTMGASRGFSTKSEIASETETIRKQWKIDAIKFVSERKRTTAFTTKQCYGLGVFLNTKFSHNLENVKFRERMARLGYVANRELSHERGSKIITEITKLIEQLPRDCSMSVTAFSRLCGIIGALLHQHTREFPDLSEISRLPVWSRCISSGNTYSTLVMTAKNLLCKGSLCSFIGEIASNKKWRSKYFYTNSPMNDDKFLESLCKALTPLNSKIFYGAFHINTEVFLPEQHHVEVCCTVRKILSDNNPVARDEYIISLIEVLIRLFEEGFVPPDTAVIDLLKTPWYTFCMGSLCRDDQVPLAVMQQTADELSMSDIADFRTLLALGILRGFRCALVADWLIFCSIAAEENKLYREESPMTDRAAVLCIAEALSLISDIMVSTSDEVLLDNL